MLVYHKTQCFGTSPDKCLAFAWPYPWRTVCFGNTPCPLPLPRQDASLWRKTYNCWNQSFPFNGTALWLCVTKFHNTNLACLRCHSCSIFLGRSGYNLWTSDISGPHEPFQFAKQCKQGIILSPVGDERGYGTSLLFLCGVAFYMHGGVGPLSPTSRGAGGAGLTKLHP